MNSSREEQVMLTDAARIHEEAGADGGGNEIRQAVIAGIERGRRRSWQGRLRTGSLAGLAAAAVVACILFFIPMIQELAPQSAAPAETAGWGELENFKRLYSFDSEAETLDSAIRHGYIQQVNRSATSGNYRITLNAVTADDNKIIFLYTANVAAGQEIYSVNSARIKNLATGYNLDDEGQIGGHDERSGPLENRIYYGRGVIHLDRNQPFPEQLEADFQIASVDPGKLKDPKTGKNAAEMNYSPRLKISFKLDPKFKEQQTVIVKPEADFMLEGIQVTLKQVELSPLMTRVVIGIKNGSENTWPNRQKIFLAVGGDEIQSVTKAGTVSIGLSAAYGNEEGFERRYGSNLLDQPESMNLLLKTGKGKNAKEITVPILP
ncbi:DUF4179 domain-containing protein [Paenibacillus tritici]|uniref:DUF4179 domain-containing protein n=1 Tax=Paenibacillus tritici TaxID=1873425 RepID=A0ABX2DJI4_9BACL|nr:DUF4179 domain-containing protein [Paenibacillus tritici]NQX43996.1 DUF4179 domain-containing protein [Paenibacillus tritici]